MAANTGWLALGLEGLAGLGQAVCVGLAAWLGADEYRERQQAKMYLYLISQTGWRAPIEMAWKSDDPEVVRLATEVQEELCSGWPRDKQFPPIMDVEPPAQVRKIYNYWRAQRELHYLTYTITFGYTFEMMDETSREMTVGFVNDAIQGGCPPFLLTQCLLNAKPKPPQIEVPENE